jgi:sodium/bile acid cotransporter 7
MSFLADLVVAFLFFLHGAKLSRENLKAGLANWPLHLIILASTFLLFPLLALGLKPLWETLAGHELYLGILFLATLPSTVQSSIVFTSLSRGNVAAAVCAASGSSLLGVFLTPLLVSALVRVPSFSWGLEPLGDLFAQLLAPFVVGQIARPKLAPLLQKRRALLGFTDRLAVIFIVYVSFSSSLSAGVFRGFSLQSLGGLAAAASLLLALALTLTFLVGKAFRFSREDRVAILFCGSKKSLMAGVPIANIIFPPAAVGAFLLPLMVFHQIQLIVCAWLARLWARGVPDDKD